MTKYRTKHMKAKSICGLIAASLIALVGCGEKEDNPATPSLSVDPVELAVEQGGGQYTVTVNATRDWTATTGVDWIAVDPASGKGSGKEQLVTVSVLSNGGNDREGSVKFTIGFDDKTLTVSQKGEAGSAEAAIVYKNDFDKETATKTYGTSSSSWPYLDQFEGWKNASGTGVGSETYAYNGMSARANSTSNGNYADYAGSGNNNLFFGSSAYFSVSGIKLGEARDYTLSFGAEKYSQDGSSVFSHSEFHVYVGDGSGKWVELGYAFAKGTDPEGRWDLASTNFTLPAATTTLDIYVKADVASVYRLDDLSLTVSSEAGTAIDFSKGVDLGGGSTGGGDDWSSAEAKTVAEFISAANTSTYYKLTGTVSGFNATYCSFDLTDATGTIYVYSVDNKSDWSSTIKNGGTVTLAGKYAYYSDKSQHEVVNAQIISFTEGTSGGDTDTAGGSGTLADPYNPKAAYDAAAALDSDAVSTNDMYVKGKISSVKFAFSAQYGTATFNISADGTTSGTQFTCYSVYYLGNRAWVDGDQQIAVGDEVVICGKFTNYQGNTPETASKQAYIYSLNGQTSIATGDVFGVASQDISVGASATSATVSVTGNVAWTASVSDGAALSTTSGTGAGDITVTFPANTSAENAVTYTVTVSTSADVATKSYTVTITQDKVSTSAEVKVSFDKAALAAAANKGATVKMDDVISFTNSSDYGTNTVTELRIYKSQTLSFSAAAGYVITGIEFTCTASDTTKQGPGCFGTGAPTGYTYNGKNGQWTGSASSVEFTAVDNQVRIVSLTVKYIAK